MTRRCRRVQGLRLERCQPGGKSDEKKANQRIAHFCQFLWYQYSGLQKRQKELKAQIAKLTISRVVAKIKMTPQYAAQ